MPYFRPDVFILKRSSLFVIRTYLWHATPFSNLHMLSNFLHVLISHGFTICYHFLLSVLLQRRNMARLLLGDSNVIRYLPMLKEKKSDPAIQSVVLARATNAVTLQDSLCHPKTAHSTVIVSAVTNLLTAKYFDDFDDMTAHCKTVFNDLLLWIHCKLI